MAQTLFVLTRLGLVLRAHACLTSLTCDRIVSLAARVLLQNSCVCVSFAAQDIIADGVVSLALTEFNTTFVMHNEDHTLGNALRMMLNQNPKVRMLTRAHTHERETQTDRQTDGQTSSCRAHV